MTPTVPEALIFALPLPIVIGTVSFLIWRRRRNAKRRSVEDAEPVGTELASRIASYLEGGLIVAFRHKEYCGLGLRFAGQRFIYGHVMDGELPTSEELLAMHWNPGERQEFASREEFVSWLASQTTVTLIGDNNQRLTKRRLLDAARFCGLHPQAQWTRYAG